MAILALVRHGESEWNAKGLWTGLIDVSLSEIGRQEAEQAGNLLKDISFQFAFTSKLKRSKETLSEIKKVLHIENIPIQENTALNERDYGELTGKNKWHLKDLYGEEKFKEIRRGWNVPIPKGETLKDVYDRVVPYYTTQILPLLKMGKNVLVTAHGNSLRALVKFLEGILDDQIPFLEIPTGEVYVYTIDAKGAIVSKEVRN